MAANKNKRARLRLDAASLVGLVVAVGGIVGGLLLEGGELKDIGQYTAAVIVFGGTIGAVLVSTPWTVLRGAARQLLHVFFDRPVSTEAVIEEIITYARKARRSGVVGLEDELEKIQDPFLRKAITLAVDGTDLTDLRNIMELEVHLEEQRCEEEARVFEAAGGYAPTIGIIGAVLGLIQVMKNLADIDEVGHGIAVAFVATIYGVGSANLFFLPAAHKIRARAHREAQLRQLMLLGVIAILEGLNPRLIRSKLEAFARREELAGHPERSDDRQMMAPTIG